jgi:hypothetical protein
MENPFPGPRAYGPGERERFFGRKDLSHRLVAGILARRSVTVYGPAGAGRASVMRALVLPKLVEAYDARVARVDSWPVGQDPRTWLAMSLHTGLGLTVTTDDLPPEQQVRSAMQRAMRRSSRLIVVYLDRVEQLLQEGHVPAEVDLFFTCLDEITVSPLYNVRVVLSLLEGSLGLLEDRLRDQVHLRDFRVRVAPLTVAEMSVAVCQAAAAGTPPQTWSLDETRALLRQLCAPGQTASDEAEVQAAPVQVVCRALFQERAEHGAAGAAPAEAILARYLAGALGDPAPAAH